MKIHPVSCREKTNRFPCFGFERSVSSSQTTLLSLFSPFDLPLDLFSAAEPLGASVSTWALLLEKLEMARHNKIEAMDFSIRLFWI
jgi:hypothetical protein